MTTIREERVWSYPRPPALLPCHQHVRVVYEGIEVADSPNALRVLETSHPPTIYVPPEDVQMLHLRETSGASYCEFKGYAAYYDVLGVSRAAWTYPHPKPPYEELKDHISFYPGLLECYLDDELVHPQPGGYYGGWITSNIIGPYKGGPGTSGW